jgi:immune inhibitor A
MLANGSADLVQRREGATVELADGDYVEFPIQKTDKIFTILSQFGTEGSGRLGRTPGPLHNEIPQPDRTQNNSTAWQADFDRAYYEDLFNGDGESFKDYYLKLSSGRYTAVNTVTVTVTGNASTYGDIAVEDTGGSWAFVEDTGNAWYAAQLAAGQDHGRDRRLPRPVRRVGPLRLRRGRQLQRARRLPRPLPGGARR